MFDKFEFELNKMLVETYRSIAKIEEDTIRNIHTKDLTISSIHIMETVGNTDGGMFISDIAKEHNITLPSVTQLINKLEKKGYVLKEKNMEDGRRVRVSLTKLGKKITSAHHYFHEQMVRNISNGFSGEQKLILLECLNKLNSFFAQKSKENKN